MSHPLFAYPVAAQGFGERLERALFNYQSQIGRRTYAEIGKAVAVREGRAEPYSAQAISDWVNGNREPSISAIRAIALTIGVTTDSLIVGDDVNREGAAAAAPTELPEMFHGEEVKPKDAEPDATARRSRRRK